MADMKSNQHEDRDGQTGHEKDEHGNEVVEFTLENSAPQEDSSSDGTSNHDSVGTTSMDDDLIVTPQAVAAAAHAQSIKKTLSKQPSNGIHVLKPDGLSTTNGLPPFPNPDSSGDVVVNKHSKEEDITFDPNGSYYMANACCELIHYRTAAILVGFAEICLVMVWGGLIGYFYSTSGGIDSVGPKTSIGIQSIVAAGFLAIVILMFIGVKTERPMLLWPHMITQITGIVVGIALTVVAVIAMCAGTSWAESIFSAIFGAHNLPRVEAALGPIWPFCLAVVFDFAAALGIWFYIVIKGCYEYQMDKIFFEKEFNNGHSLSLKKENLDASTKKPS